MCWVCFVIFCEGSVRGIHKLRWHHFEEFWPPILQPFLLCFISCSRTQLVVRFFIWQGIFQTFTKNFTGVYFSSLNFGIFGTFKSTYVVYGCPCVKVLLEWENFIWFHLFSLNDWWFTRFSFSQNYQFA